ncbi:hypothetical protein N8I77_009838 [Diaporthe amygdali]|uniref:Uncharacterized protein n=1 Tax=Phomopsis amygdali TaxID=1214568 RepID=A0AAD9SB16_PHOAM|nr:hypothetical protein N8I77_009838 [Diaporthe amygdali]
MKNFSKVLRMTKSQYGAEGDEDEEDSAGFCDSHPCWSARTKPITREMPIFRPLRASMLDISGRLAPVDTAQPVIPGRVSQITAQVEWSRQVDKGRHTQGRLDAGDPPLGQANADIDLVGAKGGDHVASARGKRDKLGIKAKVLAGEVDRGGKVLGHVADAKRGRGHGVGYVGFGWAKVSSWEAAGGVRRSTMWGGQRGQRAALEEFGSLKLKSEHEVS